MAHDKLKEALHYVIARCDDPARLGAIRLNKIMHFADRYAYRVNGTSITADTYVKQRFGPVPKNVRAAIAELAAEQKIVVREASVPGGHTMRHFFGMKEVEADTLSEQDRKILDAFTGVICDNFSANEISDATHDQVWEAAESGEEIPLFTAFAKRGEITSEVRAWATEAVTGIAA